MCPFEKTECRRLASSQLTVMDFDFMSSSSVNHSILDVAGPIKGDEMMERGVAVVEIPQPERSV